MANPLLTPTRLSYQESHFSSGVNNSTPEAATQTFNDGAMVLIVNGGVTEPGGTSNPARIDGVAIGNANNYPAQLADGLHNHPFTLPDSGIIYLMSIDNSAAQGAASAFLPASAVGNTYGITKDVIGSSPAGTPLYWYVDVNKAGANQRVEVVGFPIWSPPGTVNGVCEVKFLTTSSIT